MRNATVDGATFATLTGTSESLAKLGIFKPATSALAGTVKDIGINMAAGIPAGFVSAEGQSLLGQGRFASGSELKQSAMDFATIGGALTALTHGVGAAQTSWRGFRTGESNGHQPASEAVIFKPPAPPADGVLSSFVGPRPVVEPVGSAGPGALLERPNPTAHDEGVSGAKKAPPVVESRPNQISPPEAVEARPSQISPPDAVMPGVARTIMLRTFDDLGRLSTRQYPEGSKRLSLGSSELMLVPGENYVPV